MPFFDRCRGWRVVGAVFTALCALVFPLRFLALALPFDQRAGISPRSDIIIAGVSGTVLIALTVILLIGVRCARERIAWRADAINGLDVIPRAPSNATHQPLETPLELVWRTTPLDRLFAVFACLFVVGWAIILCALCVSGIVILISGNAQGFKTFHAMAGGFILIVACLVFASWGFSWDVRDGLGRSPRIIANEEGITSQPRWGASRFIRWEDMRLLEVWFYRRPRERREKYILYSHDTAIRWNDTYARGAKYAQRHRLLDLIHERTGLSPGRLAQGIRARQQPGSAHNWGE